MQPPQNPYGQQGSYEQPNPYMPPNPGPPNPGVFFDDPLQRPPRGKVSLDVISDSWKLVSPNIGNWILLMLVIFAVYVGIAIVGNVIQTPVIIWSVSSSMRPGAGAGTGSSFMGILAITTVLSFIWNFFSFTWLFGGVIRVALDSLRTRKVDIGKVFSGNKGYWRLLGGTFLTSLVFLITALPGEYFIIKGYLPVFAMAMKPVPAATPFPGAGPMPDMGQILLGYALLLPATFLCMGFCLTQPLILDKGMGPLEAFMASWKGLQKHFLMLFVFGVVTYLLNMVGTMVCCVGLLVTMPMTIVAYALIYRDIFGLDANQTEVTPYSGAPISDPQM